MRERELSRVGWREWVSLPELDVRWVKAKVDTGARSSAIHAYGIVRESVGGEPWVRFKLHPYQRTAEGEVEATAALLDRREVRSSSGVVQRRFVIRTELLILGESRSIELTLASRDAMGFRMLIGREAVRHRFVVDPGRSYLGGRPPIETRRMGRRKRP